MHVPFPFIFFALAQSSNYLFEAKTEKLVYSRDDSFKKQLLANFSFQKEKAKHQLKTKINIKSNGISFLLDPRKFHL